MSVALVDSMAGEVASSVPAEIWTGADQVVPEQLQFHGSSKLSWLDEYSAVTSHL